MTQFSLFGAAAAEPSLDDLDGVLLAGGQWVRSPSAARLSVVVADRWRGEALAAEFAARGLAANQAAEETAENVGLAATGGFAARTGFCPELMPAATRWIRGANQGPPTDLRLTAGGLRLWAIASGHVDQAGYLLATARSDDVVHLAAGAQLSRLGLAAVSVSARGGPGWRVTSVKRLRRLAELLGAAPDGAAADWPHT